MERWAVTLPCTAWLVSESWRFYASVCWCLLTLACAQVAYLASIELGSVVLQPVPGSFQRGGLGSGSSVQDICSLLLVQSLLAGLRLVVLSSRCQQVSRGISRTDCR